MSHERTGKSRKHCTATPLWGLYWVMLFTPHFLQRTPNFIFKKFLSSPPNFFSHPSLIPKSLTTLPPSSLYTHRPPSLLPPPCVFLSSLLPQPSFPTSSLQPSSLPPSHETCSLVWEEGGARRRNSVVPLGCSSPSRHIAWTYVIAREFGVPCFLFHGFSCFSLFCLHNLHLNKSHETASSPTEPFVLPGLPHRFEITRVQLPLYFQLFPQYQEMCDELREGELAVDGEIVNSFGELELGYAERLEAATRKKVWTVGPVWLCNKGRSDMADRGNESMFDDQCLNWLDSKKPQSVVYVSFGSMGRFTPAQMMELGSGLLASNRPFIWVIRAGERSSEEVEDWLMEKLEKNADSRCLLIRGWAPQVMILAHPAVGGFVTHCGWNSTLEAVSSGLPMVTWPLFSEQFLNDKLVVDVLGIGVAVGVRTATEWGRGGEDGVVVGREEVAKAVERLMDGGEEGKERRRRAKELGEKAKKAMEKDGSSYSNTSNLIQYVAERAAESA